MRSFPVPVVLALVFLSGCDGPGGGGGGAGTPEGVLQKAEAARKAEDWQTYVDCHTPETQAAIVRQNLETALTLHSTKKLAELGGPQAVAQVEKKLKPLTDVFAKHGISSAELDALVEMSAGKNKDQALDATAAKVKDQRGFAADMMAFSHKMITKGAKVQEATSTIKSVKIDGDRATAMVSSSTGGGPALEIPMELKKTASGWKIDNTKFFQ